tara:strand:- start:4785 stop:5066 length:282 start_codon:yes stop_codon:yes gene_type:complete
MELPKTKPKKRNSNSNLGDMQKVEKSIKFKKNISFDERLDIELQLPYEEIGNRVVKVIVEAPEKIVRAIKINSKGIFLKNKEFYKKDIYITLI